MEVLIVANGKIRNAGWYRPLIKESRTVIAADGGADNCIKLGITPDYIIGDMDSISKGALKKFEGRSKIIRDNDQDRTDLQLAIGLANSLKAMKITIIGAIGDRMDHTMANALSMTEAKSEVKIVDEFNEIRIAEKGIELSGEKDDIVSVIALSGLKGMTYEGLRWKVKNADFPAGWIGICNRMTRKKARISLSSGKILVIRAREVDK